MKLKLDADGHVVVENSLPVYIFDDDKEIPFDVAKGTAKITVLNVEANQHCEAKEQAAETGEPVLFTTPISTEPTTVGD